MGDFLIISERCCEFFDEESRLCKVYDKRFKVCSRCRKVTPLRASLVSYLPPTCSYVMWAKRHHIRLRRDKEMVFSDESGFPG